MHDVCNHSHTLRFPNSGLILRLLNAGIWEAGGKKGSELGLQSDAPTEFRFQTKTAWIRGYNSHHAVPVMATKAWR